MVEPIHNGLLPLITPALTSGLTVIVKVLCEPVQVMDAFVKAGVTVIVAVTGTTPVLIAVNAAIFPVPPAARPMVVLLLVQLYTEPGTVPEKFTAAVEVLLQTVWFEMAFTVGDGFTVMVNILDVPKQVLPPFVNDGVTVMVAVTGMVPLFVAVNAPIFPEPLAAKPIDGVLFTQLYTVPGTKPLKLTAVVEAPLQTTWFAAAFTVGVGFIVTVKF